MDEVIDAMIPSRIRDLGGFSVRRVLPAAARRLVGPFIFFDHIGPVALAPGEGGDTRPHPHIGLATITYLFDGEMMHRDSIGSEQAIRPGDVNWMIAGRGIAHSERHDPEMRARSRVLHGIQTWVALPLEHEEMAPAFEHHPARTLPVIQQPGAELRVIMGTAYGARSPAGVLSPTLYVHARLAAGAELAVDETHEERAVYAVDGDIEVAGQPIAEGTLVTLAAGAPATIRAVTAANAMLVGGASIGAPRHIWWNFVSSSQERIERAKAEWRAGRFGKVIHDETDFIPLPDR